MFWNKKEKCTQEIMGTLIKKKVEWRCMVFNCRI